MIRFLLSLLVGSPTLFALSTPNACPSDSELVSVTPRHIPSICYDRVREPVIEECLKRGVTVYRGIKAVKAEFSEGLGLKVKDLEFIELDYYYNSVVVKKLSKAPTVAEEERKKQPGVNLNFDIVNLKTSEDIAILMEEWQGPNKIALTMDASQLKTLKCALRKHSFARFFVRVKSEDEFHQAVAQAGLTKTTFVFKGGRPSRDALATIQRTPWVTGYATETDISICQKSIVQFKK